MILLRRISLISVIVLLGWISFVAEPLQTQYSTVVNLALLILLLFSLFVHKESWQQLFFEKEDLLLGVYLLIIICGIFVAQDYKIALKWLYRFFITIPILYLLIKNEFCEENRGILIKCICFFGCILVLVGLVEFIFRKNFIYEYLIVNPYYYRFIYFQPRIMSTLLHPAVLGSYFVACLPFSFFLATTAKTRLPRYFGIFCAILYILGVVLTFSRGSMLGIIVAFWIYFLKNKKKLFLKIFFTCLAILFIISSLFVKNPTFQRFGWNGLIKDRIYAYRIERAYITYKILKDHPFFGLGLNNLRFLFDKYQETPFGFPLEYKIADNMYLTILAETGIAGFLAFMGFIIFLLRRAFIYMRLTKEPETKQLVTALIAGIAGLMINMVTYELLYWTTPLFLFWILTAMTMAVTRIGRV